MSKLKEIQEQESEFDWFLNETREDYSSEQYSDLVDLKKMAEQMLIFNDAEDQKEDALETIEQTVDIKEGLDGGMNYTFSNVYERLCGYQTDKYYDVADSWISFLNEKCEVIQSSLKASAPGETAARIDVCLRENGAVILLVDNEDWKRYSNCDGTGCFMDSGLRTLEITGKEKDTLIVDDYADGKKQTWKLSLDCFSDMNGLMLEVLK